jgi:acetyl esterase/lipase
MPDIYKIWEGQSKPFFKESGVTEYEKEFWGDICVFDVVEPTLTVYPACGNNIGIGVVILSGGGYMAEAIHAEGYKIADALAQNGITAAVLKYRLPKPETSDQPHLVPLADTRQGLKFLRRHSGTYGIHTDMVGLLGFSAGGHLATVTSLWSNRDPVEIPDFTGLIYGVTVLSDENIKWLEESLYHRKMTPQELDQNCLLNLVTSETPPAFLIHAYDDDVCKIEESTLYAQRLFENKVPVELHMFHKGGHGFGLGRMEDGTDQWLRLFVNWLKLHISRRNYST